MAKSLYHPMATSPYWIGVTTKEEPEQRVMIAAFRWSHGDELAKRQKRSESE